MPPYEWTGGYFLQFQVHIGRTKYILAQNECYPMEFGQQTRYIDWKMRCMACFIFDHYELHEESCNISGHTNSLVCPFHSYDWINHLQQTYILILSSTCIGTCIRVRISDCKQIFINILLCKPRLYIRHYGNWLIDAAKLSQSGVSGLSAKRILCSMCALSYTDTYIIT